MRLFLSIPSRRVYIGAFVLHCHILDHEDLGMMEVVEMAEPEGARPLRAHRH